MGPRTDADYPVVVVVVVVVVVFGFSDRQHSLGLTRYCRAPELVS